MFKSPPPQKKKSEVDAAHRDHFFFLTHSYNVVLFF